MNAVAVTRDEERSAEGKHKVLRQLIQVTAEDPLVGSPSELSELCAQLLADAPSAEMITRTLRQYGFVTKSCRKGLLGPRQHELPKAKLAEILARYGAEEWEAKGFVGSEKPGAQEEVYATQISGS